MKNAEFHRLLRSRPREDGRQWCVAMLAERIGSGRSHLTQVLRGRRPGGETWPKLEAVLTDEELRALGRGDGTKFHVEQTTNQEIKEL